LGGAAQLLSLALMVARFANLYVDRIFAERDLGAIHQLISVLDKQRQLPDEFWLFYQVYAWAPARSGVWQHYENLPDEFFQKMRQTMRRFGLVEIAEKYELGKKTWDGPDRAAALDSWLDTHAQQIHDAIFALILVRKDCLNHES
jgi:hypothetical protein